MSGPLVHHFSEDRSLTRFEPHVPKTNPHQRAAVWAIDTDHAPLYWFPRNCPRVTAWPRTADETPEFQRVLATNADRLHAIEAGWLERLLSAELFRYDFDAADFEPWPEASGQWVSYRPVEPVAVSPVGSLTDAHRSAGIELRLVPNLRPLAELVRDDRWDFSLVRMMHAEPVGTEEP